jgi:hypothetical protein
MKRDLKTRPRMKGIKQFPKLGPVGVLKPLCTIRHGPIRDAAARQNPDADLPGCYADDEGENDRSLIKSDTKPDPLNQTPTVRSSSG